MIRTRQGQRPVETLGYRRKRRWAILLLFLCSSLLVVGYAFNYFLVPYDNTFAVAAGKRLMVLAQPRHSADEDEQYDRWTKSEWQNFEEPAHLYGSFFAAGAMGEDFLVFHPENAEVLPPGQPSRIVSVDAQFIPRAVVPAPGGGKEAWVFGVRGTRKLCAARFADGVWKDLPPDLVTYDEQTRKPLEKAGVKAVPAPFGAWVAWREPQGSRSFLRVARRDAEQWVPSDTQIEYLHGDSLFTLCPEGEDAWLIYADRKVEARRGELSFLARRLTAQGVQPEIHITLGDPLRVKREVLSLSAAQFEGVIYLFVGRLGGVHYTDVTEDLKPRLYRDLQDAGGRLSHARTVAWSWVGSLMAIATLLTGTGVALLKERRFETDVEEEAPAAPPVVATLAQRGVAYAVDFVLLAPLAVLFQAFLFSDVRSAPDATRIDYYLRASFLLSLALFQVVVMVYYTLCEANFGQTVGKWVVGIEVLDASGKRITLRQAAIRNLLRIVDAGYLFSFFLGMFFILVTARGQRLGDLAAGTVVVQRRAAEEEEEDDEEEEEESE